MVEVNDERGSRATFFCKHLACSSRSTLRNVLLKYGALEHVPGVSALGLAERAALAAAIATTLEAEAAAGDVGSRSGCRDA